MNDHERVSGPPESPPHCAVDTCSACHLPGSHFCQSHQDWLDRVAQRERELVEVKERELWIAEVMAGLSIRAMEKRAEEAERKVDMLAEALERLTAAVLDYEVGQGRSSWDHLLAERAKAKVLLASLRDEER